MDGEHLGITAREHQALIEQYRKGANERVRLRGERIGWSATGVSVSKVGKK